MTSLNQSIQEYNHQLKQGDIQKAYKGIMTFMTGLSSYLQGKYPDHTAGALYFGYMDMTYFPFTPEELKRRRLKIAIVYLHEQNRFEAWLSGSNKAVQGEYIQLLSRKPSNQYTLSKVLPGVDSIIESLIVEHPDFDHQEDLKREIEQAVAAFTKDITILLTE